MMRGVSICTGIGGLDRAAEEAGITVVGQVEYDKKCVAVLEKQWRAVPRLSDVRQFRGDEFGEYDILFGGIPCQPFSIAGKKQAEKDARDLWPDTLRILRYSKPRWVVIENVANFARLSLDRVLTDLEGEGYAAGAAILPACAFGAPHQRERCFTLAYANRSGELQPQGGVRDIRRWASYRSQTALAYASGAGLQGHRPVPSERQLRHGAWRTSAPGVQRVLESRLGRAVDGITRRLDESRWPAGRNQSQEDWEAPRVVAVREPGASDRLKQLGNAVVWQQAYPVFALLVQIDALLPFRNH